MRHTNNNKHSHIGNKWNGTYNNLTITKTVSTKK